MLGSTILGLHTRFHCRNFIETVDRFLEARIEHEHSTIRFHDKETLVEPEQRERMASLRMTLREFNLFRRAGRMLADAARWRLRERIEARVQRHRVEWDNAVPMRTEFAASTGHEEPLRGACDASVPSDGRGPRT